jgi:N-methylhydantoinase B
MDFEHFRVVGYGLLPDTGGFGKHRGGLGLFRRFLILKDGTNFATYTDRVRIAPYGLFGGGDGSRTRIEIERDGAIIKVKSKDRVDLRAGDILTLYSSGGGGYGLASERDPRLIAEDVAQGYVTQSMAASLYGWSEGQ